MAKRYHGKKVADMGLRKQGMDYIHSQEQQDGAMIHEDYNCMSLLPYGVMIKPYPKNEFNLTDELNDTITGVDHQKNTLDGAKIRRAKNPKKV